MPVSASVLHLPFVDADRGLALRANFGELALEASSAKGFLFSESV